MPSVVDTIAIAKISQYLWDVNMMNQSQLFGGSIDVDHARTLYVERTSLEYGYNQGLTNLQSYANYVYGLCGGMQNLATQIYGTGSNGGTVVPGSSGSYAIYEYSANAVLNATSITFSAAIGKTLKVASRGGHDVGTILFTGTPTGNQVLWDSTTGTLYVASTAPFYDQEFVRVVVQ